MYVKDLKRQLPSTIICFIVSMSGAVRLTSGLPGRTVLPMKLNIMQELPQHREMSSTCPGHSVDFGNHHNYCNKSMGGLKDPQKKIQLLYNPMFRTSTIKGMPDWLIKGYLQGQNGITLCGFTLSTPSVHMHVHLRHQ